MSKCHFPCKDEEQGKRHFATQLIQIVRRLVVNSLCRHSCSGLLKGVAIYEQAPGHGGGWILELCREAEDKDLEENHLLEQVGDLMDIARVEIVYCPYCGAKLANGVGKSGPSFWHIQ